MKKVGYLCLVLGIVLVFSVADSSAAEYEWIMGACIMEKTESGQALMLMADLIEEYTHGKVKVTGLNLSGEVCCEKSCIDQMDMKAIHIAEISDGNYGAFSNILMANEFPYIYDDVEVAGEILKGPVFYRIREKIAKQDNRMLLTILTSGPGRHLWSNVPIKTPTELKENNLKIRAVYSPAENETIKVWGAVPTPVPWGELYQALQSKLVTAHLLQTDLTYRYKAYEASPYCAEIYYRVSSFLGIYMNLDYWKTLPPDVQSAVLKAAREAQVWSFDNTKRYEDQTREILKKLGVTFYSPTPAEMKLWKDLAMKAWPVLKPKADQEILDLVLESQGKSFPK
jgi:TRAP-type C4-dicarboxylate transport system substrate-binding protein